MRVGINFFQTPVNVDMVAYLPHARTVEPQKQLFLSNTRTNNGIGLCNQLLGNGSVNTLPCRCNDETTQQCLVIM
jgi:hypothetical protein